MIAWRRSTPYDYLHAIKNSTGNCANNNESCAWVILGDPSSVHLVVDGRMVSRDGETMDFDDVTRHNVSCTAIGGIPQPVISLSLDDETLHSEDFSRCRVEPSKESSFLDHVTCNWTATVSDVLLNYDSVRLPVTCSVQSRRVNSKPLSVSFITVLPGGNCAVSFMVNQSVANVARVLKHCNWRSST